MTKLDLDRLKGISELLARLIVFTRREDHAWKESLETLGEQMLKLAEEKQELQKVFRGIFTCNSARPCSLCSSHGGIISNLIGLAAHKGDPHEC